jgi:hypothetical protein
MSISDCSIIALSTNNNTNKLKTTIMSQSKEFMLLFSYTPSNDNQPTEEEMNEGHQHWGSFIGNIAAQGKLVSTFQLSDKGTQISADKTVTNGIRIVGGETLGGNMVITAETMAEAVELAKNCPILHIGGSVEVREITPM